MNYLTEIKRFNEFLPTSGLTSSSIVLWYGLMYIFNRSGWIKVLEIPMNNIESQTRLSRYTISRERKRLCGLGLISYTRPDGCLHGCYEILPLSERSVLQNDTTQLQDDTSGKSPENPELLQPLLQDATPPQADSFIKDKKLNSSHSMNRSKRSSQFKMDKWLASLESPWKELMEQWMEYKTARKEAYKTEMGARKCLTMLQNLSANNPQVAQQIIDQSMAYNYAGLFPLKSSYGIQQSRTEAPQYGQRIGQIYSRRMSRSAKSSLNASQMQGTRTTKKTINKYETLWLL